MDLYLNGVCMFNGLQTRNIFYKLSTLDAIQYSKYMREPSRLLHCVWKVSLKFSSEDNDASIFSLCCSLS